jgi:alkylhydroperoxidase/carboxymuconolactone decarboxylase family protein YurZ
MADKKISELPKINAISGSTVILPIVHDGTTQRMDVSTFAVYASQWSADTGSNTFIGNQIVSGNLTLTGNSVIAGNVEVGGMITAQQYNVTYVSSSVQYKSGSTEFGDSIDDTHTITGTIILNGLAIGTAELMAQTASQDGVNLRISSTTGSINTTTSSFNSVFLGISYVTGAINTTTSSFDSVFLGISSFTGSLNSLTGSYATTGSNTFRGNQSITGSLSVSAGEFNVTTGSGNMTSSLIFDHTQNDGVTLGLRHNDRLSLADHTFNVNVWAAGVYTTFVRNGTPYSILNVEAFDDNKIYLYRDTRLYNKSLVIDNNLTVQKGIVIGSGSLSIERGQFSAVTGSGALTSSLSFTHTEVDPITGNGTLELRYKNNQVGSENNAWKFVATDNGVQVRYDQYTTSNKMLFSVSSFGSNFDKLLIWRDARLFGTGLTVDDSLLVKGVITGSILATNGVVSSSNQLFELNQQTGSQDLVNLGISSITGSLIGITNTLMGFTASLDNTYATDAQLYQLYQATASIQFTTRSLNLQTGSQDLVNLAISTYTGSQNVINSSVDSHILKQATQTGSQDLVNLGISTYTGSQNVINTSVNAHILKQATQTGSQDLVNLGISSVTGSLIGITNGLMAFTAALDSTYATDAQLYQLYQATASIQFATASLNTQTGSQNTINFNISIVTSSIDAHILKQAIQTGSQDLVNLGISTYTGSQNVINSSVDSHIIKQATQTGSQDLVNLGISTFTGSLRTEVNLIEAYTASLKGAIEVSGQNINVLGMVTAQQFNVTYVSSSVMYKSGSTEFGDSSDDRHLFTGSLIVSGTLAAGTDETGWGRISFNEPTNTLRIQSSKNGTDCIPISFWSQRQGGGFAESVAISGSNLHVRSEGKLEVFRSDNTRSGSFYTNNLATIIEASTDPIRLSSPERAEIYIAGAETMRVSPTGGVSIYSGSAATIGLKTDSLYNSMIRDYTAETSTYLDVVTERLDGGGFNFLMLVSSTLVASGGNRNYYTFAVAGRGTTGTATQLSNVNAGTASRTAIAVSFPSNGVIRLTLTGAENCQIKATIIGHGAL